MKKIALPARVCVPTSKEEFRARIRRAKASAASGRVTPAEAVFDRLEAKYRAMAAKREESER